MKYVVLILGLLVLSLVAIAILKGRKSDPYESVQVKLDSLDCRFNSLQMRYDSLMVKQIQEERDFAEATRRLEEKLVVYRKQIRIYEKRINSIGTLSDRQLLDSITDYYNGQISKERQR